MSFITALPASRSLDLVSDIHVDSNADEPLDWAAIRSSDVLLIAGDVADDTDSVVAEVTRAAAVYEHIIFVPGNHDLHPGIHRTPADADELTIQRVLEEQIRLLADRLAANRKVIFLHRAAVRIGKVALFGATGWWDYRIAEPRIVRDPNRFSAYNRAFIELAATDAAAVHAHVVWANSQPDLDAIVLVTHTLPHPELLAWGYYPPVDAAMPGYGNSRMRNVAQADRRGLITHWLCGHSHAPRDHVENGIRYVNWARGAHRWRIPEYRPRAIPLEPTAAAGAAA